MKTSLTKSGGNIYEEMARKLLPDGFVIKNFDDSLFPRDKSMKTIAVIHHIDYAHSPLLLRFVYPFLGKIIFHNIKKFDAIVTVSKYWEQYFKDKGYKNVHLIYNAFDMNKFNFSTNELIEFKEKYNLTGKPIIYLGNCHKAKGVESYKVLKDLDVHLVTSGKPAVKIPAINLDLSNRDYLRLLKASSIVITMSKFKEGWCRTAHEAMLCKTPVIGSGLGGMDELLRGGRQMVVEEFKYLRERTKYLLNYSKMREAMMEDGYNFAKQFTLERFEEAWIKLINRLLCLQ